MINFICDGHDSRHVLPLSVLAHGGRLILFYNLTVSYLKKLIEMVPCLNLLYLCS